MDGIELLGTAMIRGLKIFIDGERLVVRGPQHLATLAQQLIANKAEVIRAIQENYLTPDHRGRRAFNFLRAVARDVTTGRKRRSQAEIETLLEICKACPFYKEGLCNHRQCGCNANGRQVWLNKLAWRSTSCPIGAWPTDSPEASRDCHDDGKSAGDK